MPTPMCEWCGHDHAITQLCSARPKWSRRGFLSLLGTAIIGAAIPLPTSPLAFSADAFKLVMAPLTPRGNTFITPDWVVKDTLSLMQKQLRVAAKVSREYDAAFDAEFTLAMSTPH